MNQKKIKSIRKQLRTAGIDVNDRVYDERGGRKPTAELTAITGTVYLRYGCGRQVYQNMKG